MSAGIIAGNCFSISIIDLTLTPAQVATITTAEQTFSCPGLKTTDAVLSVNPPSSVTGVTIGAARCSAADTLAIQFVNPTAGGVTPGAGTYRVTVARNDGAAASRVLT